MPKQNRQGPGRIGFGSANAGPIDQGRQHIKPQKGIVKSKSILECGFRIRKNSEKELNKSDGCF
jgi:hypothetical protein